MGHYRIVEKLGEGGMGAVYKALDTRLNRFVALKLLPAGKDASEDRLRRFLQEAQAASALNHPNIVVIHDIAEFDGRQAIVMEHVAGRTLDRVISPRGLPLADALRYAIDIAAGLEAAHAAGIIHRDLKPSNVIVADSGRAKLLDFGLAKLAASTGVGAEDATRTVVDQTAEGAILGTTSYMSPEQAEAKPLDARSDIFSFGAVLYEMVMGRKAFQGETTISTITAILRDEPKPITSELPGVPRELERIVQRCLRKDPARRFQTAADLRVALEDLKEESESGSRTIQAAPPVPAQKPTWLWLMAGLILASAAAGIWWMLKSRTPEAPMVVRNLTDYIGSENDAAFSPDGNMIAFRWDGPQKDNQDIYVRLIDSGQPLRLTTSPANDGSPLWSPDGRRIIFTRWEEQAQGYVYSVHEVPALGGAERRIVEGSALDWSDDGRWLVVGKRAPGKRFLKLVSPVDGTEQNIPQPASCLGARFSRDGEWLYCTVLTGEYVMGGYTPSRLMRMRLPSGRWENIEILGLTSVGAPVFGKDMIFAGQSSASDPVRLHRAPLEGGTPQPLPFSGGGGVTISRKGDMLAFIAQNSKTSIYRSPAFPSAARPFVAERWIVSPQGYDNSPVLSPDGRRLAVSSSRASGSQIWVSNPDGSDAKPLTSIRSGVVVGSPQWSPDGQWIAFDARADNNPDVWVVSSSGGQPRRLTTEDAEDIVPCWAQDGKHLFFTSNRSGDQQIWRVPFAGGPAEQVTQEGGFNCRVSPDGKDLYYLRSRRDGGIRRKPLAGGREEDVIPQIKTRNWVVLRDGIYSIDAGVPGIAFAPRQGEGYFYRSATRDLEKLGFTTPHNMNNNGMCLSLDGQWAYYAMTESLGSDLMVVENFR